jgi:hypothetical protein
MSGFMGELRGVGAPLRCGTEACGPAQHESADMRSEQQKDNILCI